MACSQATAAPLFGVAEVPDPTLGPVLGYVLPNRRRFAAELLVDLWDLLHMVRVGGEEPTAELFSRVRPGLLHRPRSAHRVLLGVVGWLRSRGLRAELVRRDPDDAAASYLLAFDVDQLYEFLRPEVDRACKFLIQAKRPAAAS